MFGNERRVQLVLRLGNEEVKKKLWARLGTLSVSDTHYCPYCTVVPGAELEKNNFH